MSNRAGGLYGGIQFSSGFSASQTAPASHPKPALDPPTASTVPTDGPATAMSAAPPVSAVPEAKPTAGISPDLIASHADVNIRHSDLVHNPTQFHSSVELAVSSFFQGPYVQSSSLPDVVKYCQLYPEEILQLFAIFFDRVNPFFSLLDPEYHKAESLIWTSPFLFTVVIAVASRYYSKRPNLYQLATEFARDAAGKALVDGSKSVDIVQAYLLMAVYPVPKKKWTEDRSWLLMGVAIRMAFELELNHTPSPALSERERLNRTRTWLTCYCVDGSHAIQFGKMPMLRLDDYVARNSRDWYRSSSMVTPFDIHLCAYVEIIVLMAEWRQALLESSDPVDVAVSFDKRLQDVLDVWVNKYTADSHPTDPPINTYRSNTTQLITAYLRLVVLSRGFQDAIKAGVQRESYIFTKSMDAALKVIQIVVERLFPTGHLRYAMEAHFLYVAFAAAFLLNLLRPKFLPLLHETQEQKIVTVVSRLIEILGSKEVALDGRHTPALYSRFLSSLLAKHNKRPAARRGSNSPQGDVNIYPQYTSDRQQTPPYMYSWPDARADNTTTFNNPVPPAPVGEGTYAATGTVYQQMGDADMDFSMSNFVSAVSNTQDSYHHQNSPSNFSNGPAMETFYWDYNTGATTNGHVRDGMAGGYWSGMRY